MSVSLTGLLNQPIANIKTMVAESAAFQAWVGADDAAEAAAYLFHYTATKSEIEALDPPSFALVDYAPGGAQWEQIAGGAGASYAGAWNMLLLFEGQPDPEEITSRQDALAWIGNLAGDVMEDLQEASGRNTNPSITGWTVVDVCEVSGPAEETLRARAMVQLRVGL